MINPDLIRAQVEGGLLYGLSAAAWGEVVLGDGGDIVTQNFDRYPVTRMQSVTGDRGAPDRVDRAADRCRRGQRPNCRAGTRERHRRPHRHPDPPPALVQDHPDLLGKDDAMADVTITPSENGPYIVSGPVHAHRSRRPRDRTPRPDGDVPLRPVRNKPFCDGTHATIDFDGTLAN